MSMEEFDKETEGLSPLETLRFFCSEKLLPQAWLDSERFFTNVEQELEAKDKLIDKYIQAFGHYHVKCNMDLRNPIHHRLTKGESNE